MSINEVLNRRFDSPYSTDVRKFETHREIGKKISSDFDRWVPKIRNNIIELRKNYPSEIHQYWFDRWEQVINDGLEEFCNFMLITHDDVNGDNGSGMMQMSPLGGILSQEERSLVFSRLKDIIGQIKTDENKRLLWIKIKRNEYITITELC